MLAQLFLLLGLVAAALAASTSSVVYPTPGATFDAKQYTNWGLRRVNGSKRGRIYVPVDAEGDYISLTRLDLVGDAYSRGFAHGSLMAEDIVEFVDIRMNAYYAKMVMDLDTDQYPSPLKEILQLAKVKGALHAPREFQRALEWVFEKEKKYIPQSLVDEMKGIADGMCSVLGSGCNATARFENIKAFNMFPEIIRMACTAFGAWDSATPTNTLIQVRALDFGGGPFPNYTVVQAHRNDPNNPNNAFVSVTYPGWVGAITGVSQSGIGISEKVWMTNTDPSLQPGSFDGEPDVFVLREILEKATDKQAAESYLQSIKRTWAIWIGIGDYKTKTFDLVGYKQDSAIAYNDVTAPTMTGQPYIKNVAYVDKHPQPSRDGASGTLPVALQDFWGNISLESVKTILKYHETGDMQIATYDFGSKEMYVAIGKVNVKGEYMPVGGSDDNLWCAYNRPYLRFSLPDLWSGK